MGIIEKGVNGPFKGKAGSVVGSSWKGINYIKGLPRKNGTKRIPSSQQALQQQRFRLLNDFFRPLSDVLNVGLKPMLAKATGINAAFTLNYEHAFLEDAGNISLNYKALQFSRGSLCTAGAEKAWVDNKKVAVTWNIKTYGMGGEMDDIAYVLVYLPEINVFFSDMQQATRQDGITHVDLLGNNTDTEIHVWLFFADKQQRRASQTVYIPLASDHS